MNYFRDDIIVIINSLTLEYSKILKTDLSTLDPTFFTTYDVVGVLTVALPKYDGFLLSYLEGTLDEQLFLKSCDLKPFDELAKLVVEGKPVAIEAFRQLSLLGKKLKAPCPAEKDSLMIDRLYWTDRSLPWYIPDGPIVRLARQLCADVLGDISPQAFDRVTPGSGASADRVPPSVRYNFKNIITTDRIAGWFGTPSHSSVKYISRVLTVPKDARGPRVICCEPASLMSHQKSVQLYLHDLFNSSSIASGHVNVLNQNINQELARIGSIDRSVATLDMAEASDRVSIALVKAIVPAVWFDLLMSLRSPQYTVEGSHKRYKKVTMRKFAPMGSALCFPIETLCFWALSSAAVARKLGISVQRASKKVVVHGDDTIVPVSCYSEVAETLEAFGLKVNLSKSFAKGFFRESCGGDYFKGHDVTPCRINNLWESPLERCVELMNLRNIFYTKGLWSTAACLESLIGVTNVTCSITSPLPSARVTYVPAFEGGKLDRFCSDTHTWSTNIIGEKKVKPSDRPNDVGRWFEYWLQRHTYESRFLPDTWEGSRSVRIIQKGSTDTGRSNVVFRSSPSRYSRPLHKEYTDALVSYELQSPTAELILCSKIERVKRNLSPRIDAAHYNRTQKVLRKIERIRPLLEQVLAEPRW